MSAFDHALEHALREEGGYVNHPKDPGGATNMGITQRTLESFKTRHPELDLPGNVVDLKREHVAIIYRLDYWNVAGCDALPAGLALIHFDAAVNQGVKRATSFLADAKRAGSDARAQLREYAARRAWAYMVLDQLDDTFGLGWARRLFRTYEAALAAKE